MEFDRLKMYFGEPYPIDTPDGKQLTVLQPTLGDLLEIGETKFFATLNIFITNTTTYRAILWDGGLDWNEISDFDLFILLYHSADQEVINLLFDDFVVADFGIAQKNDETHEIVLRNPKTGVVIDKDVYEHFHRYLQEAFKMKPEDEFTNDRMLKQWWVDKDKRAAGRREAKKEDKQFSIQPMISAAVNHPGFKYKLRELKEVGICEFYDSIQRLQVYESSTAVMKGMFSGMVDSKSISPDQYNWMKEI